MNALERKGTFLSFKVLSKHLHTFDFLFFLFFIFYFFFVFLVTRDKASPFNMFFLYHDKAVFFELR